MFKRMFIEDWAHIIPFISFFIFATVFIFVTIRAMRLDKAERTRLAALRPPSAFVPPPPAPVPACTPARPARRTSCGPP